MNFQTDQRQKLYPLGIQAGRQLWQKFDLASMLQQPDRTRLFYLRQQIATELRATTSNPLSAAELQLWGVLNQALHLLAQKFLGQTPLQFSASPTQTARRIFQQQLELFPLPTAQRDPAQKALLKGERTLINFCQIELCLLCLQAENPALRDGRRLFNGELQQLKQAQPVAQLLQQIDQQSAGPASPFAGRSLLALLEEAIAAAPHSLSGQLSALRQNWGRFLPQALLDDCDSALKLRQAEFQTRGPVDGAAPVTPGFWSEGESANFTPDRDWMPRSVLLAKAVFVWLSQLSERYGTEITRLDQIPDQELDQLGDFGFTGLWLIGIWQRSEASRKIKHQNGQQHVSASAYAIHDYCIATELGGDAALDNLKERCRQRGIHLACDVVTNHTGIDSQWLRQHPDWFIQAAQPPYPGYRFNGPNLSDDERLCIQIEDGYADQTEAAVVFRYANRHSGEVRYIYHGNDGTHLPWNDTAQLNFLLPQVRETMIQVILTAAQRFGIIRFDAAMTLAKKHFQRLWFPLPGSGEGVPSRSASAISQDEFNHYFPQEFWREVVERIKTEQPDTLLVAEAFWLMEGYFVRNLGMHRVYNSAFMNMLMREDNAAYRQTLDEILKFDPAILQRFVNFMSNPDEKTAIEQFGNGEKYFCVATLLCTMPGLPLFAHGQVEGLREKYGMEYTRPDWQEQGDPRLIEEHWQRIAPLLRQRELFSGAENFQLYDFMTEAGVAEDIYAFSNRRGSRRVLVLCNNSSQTIQGEIGPAVTTKDGTRPLKAELGLTASKGFYRCQSLNQGEEYLWPAKAALAFRLDPYAHLVLDGFQYEADADGRWQRLYQQLDSPCSPNLLARAQLVDCWDSFNHLKDWLESPEQSAEISQWPMALVQNLQLQDLAAVDLLKQTAAICLAPPWHLSHSTAEKLASVMTDSRDPAHIIMQLFSEIIVRKFLNIHQADQQNWFRCEEFTKLIFLIVLQKFNSHKSTQNNISDFTFKFKNSIIKYKKILRLAHQTGYQLDIFLQSLDSIDSATSQITGERAKIEDSALKILFITSEATPFAKTGGLADVAGSLPRALRQLGHDVRVIMPCYRSAQRNGFALAKGRKSLDIPMGGETIHANMRQTIREGVPYHFIDAPEYFDRAYLYGTPDGDYQDNAYRFAFFCRAVLEYLRRADYRPDVLHLHDWQAALVAALLKTECRSDPFYSKMASLLTIHNLGYQGIFPLSKIDKLDLPTAFGRTEHLEYFGNISYLKGGIVHADLINTVSPTYCQEIQQPEQGHGFDGLLRSRSRDLHGILNGINEKNWDPALDPALNKPFSSSNLNGKRSCKRALQKELGLAQRHDLPLLAVVSRLDTQKGIDLIEAIWPQLMQRELQFVLLGSGNQEQTAFWKARQQEKADNYAISLEFDENLSRRIYSAADCLLVPSRYEPCGLTQMIALRYGALPIVRHTGGLADTVIDLQQETKKGNGFVFNEAKPEELLATIDRALELFPQRKRWLPLIKKGMESDFSWTASAKGYEDLYRQALEKHNIW